MRDQRFVAKHRGGPLDLTRHRLLATWAADCAAHVLSLCAAGDDRPRHAIAIAQTWANGEVPVGTAQKAAVGAHAAARAAQHPAAIAAARAAGHAAATAHMADHALGAALYARKAVSAAQASIADECAWQIAQLPSEIRDLVISALTHERFKSFPQA